MLLAFISSYAGLFWGHQGSGPQNQEEAASGVHEKWHSLARGGTVRKGMHMEPAEHECRFSEAAFPEFLEISNVTVFRSSFPYVFVHKTQKL